ncbi:hypothetical protein EV182_002882 [Spiromyces aspiralis]|uniref:Uncharacterized protein n=1 Tax=Spiromyces aspiralis TaxID=68401 RepID=A0ACC1HDE7_9FUNG|nr:hypothetical protein EV182_002882 [Spiromyces aspiralis]
MVEERDPSKQEYQSSEDITDVSLTSQLSSQLSTSSLKNAGRGANNSSSGGGFLIDQIDRRKAVLSKERARSTAKYSRDAKKEGKTGSDDEEEEDSDVESTNDKGEHDFDDIQPPLDDLPPWMQAIVYAVALSGVYGLFEALVNQQYSIEITFVEVLRKMAQVIPAMAVIVYFTQRFAKYQAVKALMLAIATACGCYFIHLNLHSPRMGIMKRAPGLASLWIYLTVVMEVRAAIINVLVVCAFWLLDPFESVR